MGALASYSWRVIAHPTAAKVIAQIDIDAEFVRPLLNRLDYLIIGHALEFRLMASYVARQ
jgi:hypothetical protein